MLPLLLLGLLAVAARGTSPSSAPPDPAPSLAKQAAQALWMFLTRTGRFGSATDRVPQVMAAQRLLMVKADGIVGPITRAAAAAVGVTLPMKPSSTRPSTLTIAHPADTGASAEEQAAIDAAVSQAIREGAPPPAAANPEYAAPSSSSITPEPPPPSAELVQQASSAAKEAANLLAFLIRTRRYGTPKDRPEEVRSAQRALGVPDDGIVGPATRKAAAKLGVAIPPRGK